MTAVGGAPLPISAIGSHIVVHPTPTGLRAFRATYETAPEECLLFADLAVDGTDSAGLGWRPGRYALGPVGVCALADEVLITADAPADVTFVAAGAPVAVRLTPGERLRFAPGRPWRRESGGSPPDDPEWERWLAAAPAPAAHADLVRRAWYVLGLNTVRLDGGGPPAVVPSLFGYVAAWQWDAYFIAVGLRHGLPDVARDQLRLMLGAQRPDGQLPDVVHDGGVLASSADLPPGDLASLAASASPYLDLSRPVPLTKPPLAAWAVSEVDAVAPDPAFRAWAAAAIRRSQDWWYAAAEGRGYAFYHHPYSSGLDDSPVFDAAADVESPELAAFLLQQEEDLAALGAPAGLHRPAWLPASLLALYRPELRTFGSRAHAGGQARWIDTDAVTGLLPAFWRGLPDAVVAGLSATASDPDRFGFSPGLPTVGRLDPDFDPARMWRGPVWLNTNALLARGLERHGMVAEADALERSTLDLVARAGAFAEYYDAETGRPAPTAVDCFAWTAALVVDLAMRVSSRTGG